MNQSQLSPYLTFPGNCEEAMNFYQSVLGGQLEISRFSDYASTEMPVSDDYKDKVMHSTLKHDSLSFMASDTAPDSELIVGDNISLSIAGNELAALTTYFNGLSAGGTVTMPLATQVWGDSFGMFTDKFGIHWMVNIAKGDAPSTEPDSFTQAASSASDASTLEQMPGHTVASEVPSEAEMTPEEETEYKAL